MEPNVNEQQQQQNEVQHLLGRFGVGAGAGAQEPGAEEDGLVENPQQTDEHVEAEQPSPAGQSYTLDVPPDVPLAQAEEWRPMLEGFASAASAAGIPQSTAEQLVQGFVDGDVAITHSWEPGPHFDSDDAEKAMRNIWRDKFDAQHAQVRKAVASFGPGFADWLDEGMGNHPAVLMALAEFGAVGRLSKSEAQAELNRIMSDAKGDYFSQDSWRRAPAVLRVQMLSRLANSETKVTHPYAVAKNSAARSAEAQAEKDQVALRSEAQKLYAETRGFTRGGSAAELADKKQRWMELVARIAQ